MRGEFCGWGAGFEAKIKLDIKILKSVVNFTIFRTTLLNFHHVILSRKKINFEILTVIFIRPNIV